MRTLTWSTCGATAGKWLAPRCMCWLHSGNQGHASVRLSHQPWHLSSQGIWAAMAWPLHCMAHEQGAASQSKHAHALTRPALFCMRSRHPLMWQLLDQLPLEQQYALKCLPAIGQAHVLMLAPAGG